MLAEFTDTVLVPTLYSLALAVVSTLATVAISAVKQWGEKQKNELARDVLARAAEAADRAVLMVNQVYVEGARNPDGSLSASASREALRMAMGSARGQLGAEGVALLARVTGGSAAAAMALRTMVEAAVNSEKPMLSVRQSSDAFLAGRG